MYEFATENKGLKSLERVEDGAEGTEIQFGSLLKREEMEVFISPAVRIPEQ